MVIKKKSVIRIIFIIAVLCLVAFTFFSNISVNDNQIKGSGIFSFKIEIDDITSIEIIENDLNVGMKIFGAGLGNILKGLFDVEYYGKTTLYINKKNLDYYILIKTDENKVYILNENSKEKTKQLYNEIYDLVKGLENYKTN